MDIKKIEEERRWRASFKPNSRETVERTFEVALVVHTENGGYTEEEYEFEVFKDKGVCVSDEHGFIHISAKAAKYLRDFLLENL